MNQNKRPWRAGVLECWTHVSRGIGRVSDPANGDHTIRLPAHAAWHSRFQHANAPSLHLLGCLIGGVLLFLSSGLSWAATVPSAPDAIVTNRLAGQVIYTGSSPMGVWHGTNTAVAGQLIWSQTAGTVSGLVTVDLARWESGNKIRDRHTLALFDVKSFPTSSFQPTGFKGRMDAGPVTVLGTLSLHDVQRPVEIPGVVTVSQGRQSFQGDLVLHLADWQLKRPTLMGAAVADEVKVHVYGEGVSR